MNWVNAAPIRLSLILDSGAGMHHETDPLLVWCRSNLKLYLSKKKLKLYHSNNHRLPVPHDEPMVTGFRFTGERHRGGGMTLYEEDGEPGTRCYIIE
jgi:hypothetical protein